MSSSFLSSLAQWVEENKDINSAPTPEEFERYLSSLEAIIQDLRTSKERDEIYQQIAGSQSETVSSLELSKIMNLLSHEDEDYQEQGLQLLSALNSEEAWEAIFVGVSFEPEITHDTMIMTKGLKKAILSNPFYDYSAISILKIRAPFPKDVHFLQFHPDLERLELFFEGDDAFYEISVDGLAQAENLKQLQLNLHENSLGKKSKRLQFSKEWCEQLQNIQELEIFGKRLYSSAGIKLDYQFVDLLPNLKSLRTECCSIIHYENCKFIHHPKLYLEAHVSMANILPEDKSALKIEELRITAGNSRYRNLNGKSDRLSEISLDGIQDYAISKIVLVGSSDAKYPHLLNYVPLLHLLDKRPQFEIRGHIAWAFEHELPFVEILKEPEKLNAIKLKIIERAKDIRMDGGGNEKELLELIEGFGLEEMTIQNKYEWRYMGTRQTRSFSIPFERMPRTVKQLHLDLMSAVHYFRDFKAANLETITGLDHIADGVKGEMFLHSPKLQKIDELLREEGIETHRIYKEEQRQKKIVKEFVYQVKRLLGDRSRKEKQYTTLFNLTDEWVSQAVLIKKLKKDIKSFPSDWLQILAEKGILEVQNPDSKKAEYRRLAPHRF